MVSTIAANLAENMKQLRSARGLSQQQLAKLAGIPRPTWANLESGSGNPTISVLTRVSAALQVSVEELLGPPREACRLYRATDLLTRKRGDVSLRRLLPDATPGMDLDRMELPAGARLVGVPHRTGTREYLACESGAIELVASGETYALTRGDVVVFRGDQKHSYFNPGRSTAVAYSVVMIAPG
jgi:transcriptional regulator with XRE-family HTH domain